jgi:predicted nuclease of predicted toxin-antitoxin system
MTVPTRIKLDENLGRRGAQLLQDAGHDVSTVYEQQLTSAPDHALIDICRKEDRCLVTLDLDFSNPLVFKPADYAGIAVIRVPSKITAEMIAKRVQVLILALARSEIRGKLWIVQEKGIREYLPIEDE